MIQTTIALTTPNEPAADLDMLIRYLLIEPDASEELLLRLFLHSASAFAVRWMGRSLIAQSWVTTYDSWPWERRSYGLASETSRKRQYLVIPYPPLIEVTDIVTVAPDGTETGVDPAAGRVVVDADPAKVVFHSRVAVADSPASIKVYFVGGYGANFTAVPASIQMGVIKHAAFLYENRGCSELQAAEACGAKGIYQQYKVGMI